MAENIADCEYDRSFPHLVSCDAVNDHLVKWTVDVAQGDRCKPVRGRRVICGERESNTRCVCSDTDMVDNINQIRSTFIPKFNECRCQYWPQNRHTEL